MTGLVLINPATMPALLQAARQQRGAPFGGVLQLQQIRVQRAVQVERLLGNLGDRKGLT